MSMLFLSAAESIKKCIKMDRRLQQITQTAVSQYSLSEEAIFSFQRQHMYRTAADLFSKAERKSEKVCPICNKTFEGTPRQKYCSKECYKVSQRDSRRERYNRDKSNGCYDKGGKYEYNKYRKKVTSKKKNVK
jgi:predicted transcriptional regulator